MDRLIIPTNRESAPGPLHHAARPGALALAVLALLAIAARPAAAQGPQVTSSREHNKDFGGTDFSPCTSEMIEIEGKQDLSEMTSPTSFRFKAHTAGRGTGMVTSLPYQFQDWTENEFRTTATTFSSTFSQRRHIIRNGSPNPAVPQKDDFFMRMTDKFIVVNNQVVFAGPDGNPQFECR